jgi:hypothetical protein
MRRRISSGRLVKNGLLAVAVVVKVDFVHVRARRMREGRGMVAPFFS